MPICAGCETRYVHERCYRCHPVDPVTKLRKEERGDAMSVKGFAKRETVVQLRRAKKVGTVAEVELWSRDVGAGDIRIETGRDDIWLRMVDEDSLKALSEQLSFLCGAINRRDPRLKAMKMVSGARVVFRAGVRADWDVDPTTDRVGGGMGVDWVTLKGLDGAPGVVLGVEVRYEGVPAYIDVELFPDSSQGPDRPYVIHAVTVGRFDLRNEELSQSDLQRRNE